MSKIIPLSIASGPFNSKGLLMQVISVSQDKPISVSDMRRRVRILDAIETADGSFIVEQSEYDMLKAAILAFPFNVANKQILSVIDDVLNAVDGPVITKAMREAALAAAAAAQAPAAPVADPASVAA